MTKKILSCILVLTMLFGCVSAVFAATPGNLEVRDGNYYYNSMDGNYVFEKVSHPGAGPGEIDGLVDDADARSQSYAWSAIEYGNYIYIGTCYNSTYGIYYRAVVTMMMGLGKTQAEAAKIARDFVQFTFNDQFDERLMPKGILIKINKKTGEVSKVYDSKSSLDPAVSASNCSGYRMAFEFKDKLYFVSLANPTMFLLEIDPKNDDAPRISYKRQLSADGTAAKIAAGVHGLIVYEDEILMCLAAEAGFDDFGNSYTEGGLILASSDATNWRVIADNADFDDLPGYHSYDGLMGGGVWDIIEYNGYIYVTVVTDKPDTPTSPVNKQGFAMYRGQKLPDGSFIWTQIIGDTSKPGVTLPYGMGVNYSMACNLWVYDGYLYMGTYNDPMLDFTAVATDGDFKNLYYDLYYSIFLYRMDMNENFELIGGKETELFPNRLGNLGDGLGSSSNQYVWRMEEHNGDLWLGTYDLSTLAYAFTQLTDGQLDGLSRQQYLNRLEQLMTLLNSLLNLEPEYDAILRTILGSHTVNNLFNCIQRMINANTGNSDPVPEYNQFIKEYENIKSTITGYRVPPYLALTQPIYDELVRILNTTIFNNIDSILDEIQSVVYYFGVNYFAKQSVAGFDLLVSSDGINFDVVTNDGFGDPSNHGVRTLTSADGGKTLYVGTANPYYGAQLWRIETEDTIETDLVTFSSGANGKFTFDNSTEIEDEYTIGEPIGIANVPAITPYEGYEFAGWRESESGEIYSSEEVGSYIVTGEVYLTAMYNEIPSDMITVNFSAGAYGSFMTGETTSFTIHSGDSVSSVPSVICDNGWSFDGWKVLNDNNVYTANQIRNMTFTESTVITAQYIFTGVINGGIIFPTPTETYTVRFQKGDHGTLTGTNYYRVLAGAKLSEIPSASASDGYEFSNWYCKADGKYYTEKEILKLAIDDNMTFVAQYDKVEPEVKAEAEEEEVKSEPKAASLLDKDNHIAYIMGYPDETIRPENMITREEVAAMLCRLLTEDARKEYSATENDFTDVDSDRWSNNAISTLSAMGIITGDDDRKFRPGDEITRAELVAMISRFENLEASDAVTFTDTADHWAGKIIEAAAEKGWILGYDDGTFKPNQKITRAETIIIINRVLGRAVTADSILSSAPQWIDNPSDMWYYADVMEASNSHTYEKSSDGKTETWVELIKD